MLTRGNLAALEDDAPPSPLSSSRLPPAPSTPRPMSSSPMASSAPPPAPSAMLPISSVERKGGGQKLGVVVALVVVTVAGAAAWFTHLIPHQ